MQICSHLPLTHRLVVIGLHLDQWPKYVLVLICILQIAMRGDINLKVIRHTVHVQLRD
jgi:hypothetical protein